MNANEKQAWADKIKKEILTSISVIIAGTRAQAAKVGKGEEIEAVVTKAMAILDEKDAEYWTNYANPYRTGGLGVNAAKAVWQEAAKQAMAK